MTAARTPLITPLLVAACTIILVSFGIRATFGVFQIPIADQFGWPRADFSHGDRHPEPRLGDRPADLRRGRRAVRRPPGDRARRALLCRRPRALGGRGDAGRAPAPQHPDRLRHRRHRLRGDPRHRRPRRLARAALAQPRHRHRRRLRRPDGGPDPRPVAARGDAVEPGLPGLRRPDRRRPRPPAADPGAGAGAGARERREHGRHRRPGGARPVLRAHLPRLLLLRLPARLRDRAFPGLRHRGLLADPGQRGAGEPRDHHRPRRSGRWRSA